MSQEGISAEISQLHCELAFDRVAHSKLISGHDFDDEVLERLIWGDIRRLEDLNLASVEHFS